MRIIPTMLLRGVIPIFGGMTLISVALFELLYFFGQLTRYLDREDIGFQMYLRLLFLYMPLALSYSIPLSFLFALVFVLSSLYDHNEVVVIHTGGVSLTRFGMPILMMGIVLSIGSFFFDNFVVTHSERLRNSLFSEVFETNRVSRSEVTVAITREGNRIYIASGLNQVSNELINLSIIDKEPGKGLLRRIDAKSGVWSDIDQAWVLNSVRIFTYRDGELFEESQNQLIDKDLNEPTSTFFTQVLPLEEMDVMEAYRQLESLKRRKLPFLETAVNFHQRFAFPFTSFIVAMIGLAMVARFRQNTLLMSLLASIGIAVSFYVLRLYSGIAGTQGAIAPWLSGWLAVLIFLVLGVFILFKAPS